MSTVAAVTARGRLAEACARVRRLLPGRVPAAALPVRVRAVIDADQRESEVLVCLVQFGAIATFALLYALTPKAFPDTVPFEPVPWMLGVYALFTAVRLALAVRGRLTPALLSLSVVIDFVVLMTTIWSFHLQYGAPAALYLKAPTVMYACVLIVLRAMRFEVRYVLLAGASAGAGWLVLVLYAVRDAEAMHITHSFAEYATSMAILVGAEVDKAIVFAAITAILAVVITRARRLLVLAATERHAASELSRFFAADVAGEIRRADADLQPGAGCLRDAAVLMTDLRGFTRLTAALPPDRTIALLGEYHARLVPVIQRHGGAIDKYLGDGIMATFGATRASERYAADALHALQAVLAEARDWSASLAARGLPAVRVGAAVAVGPLLHGVVGHESRLEYTVIGDAVNLAAKLEKHTKTAGASALTTAEALALARRQGFAAASPVVPRPAEAVAGVAAPVDLVAFD